MNIRYAIRNALPPLLPIFAGNPQTFAIPTAEPTADSTKPQLLLNFLPLLMSVPPSGFFLAKVNRKAPWF